MRVDDAPRLRRDLLAWAGEHGRDLPWRRPDATRYEVLLAELLLTQTRAEAVADVYPDLLDRYPSLAALAEADREALLDLLRPLGLQERRADALLGIAEEVDGELPQSPDELASLPGVGPYVAGATACIALEQPVPVVDTNVRRIYARLLGDEWPEGGEAAQLEVAAEVLPDDGERAREHTLALFDFGAAICVAGTPKCEACFASEYCEYYEHEVED